MPWSTITYDTVTWSGQTNDTATWSAQTNASATWSAVTSDAATWSARTDTDIAWQQLSTVTESDDGVDFVLRVNDQFPMYVRDARPAYIIDDVETP